jgi:hypothetical protein
VTEPAPWIIGARNALKAHGPMSFDAILAEVAGMIPPGRCLRRADQQRDYMRRKRGTSTTQQGPVERRVWTGARHILRSTLVGEVRAGRMLRDGDVYSLVTEEIAK